MAAPARDIPPIEPRSWKQRLPNPLEWAALALFCVGVFILVSLLLDPPSRHLRGEGGGIWLSREPFLFLGAGVYILAGLTAFWSAIIFFRNRIHNLALKAFGVTLMAVSFSTLLCLCTDLRASEAYFGGYVGSLLATSLSGMHPLLAAALVCVLFLISAVFATDWFFYELIRGDAQADPAVLDDEDAFEAVMPRTHAETRVTVAVAPTFAAPDAAPMAESMAEVGAEVGDADDAEAEADADAYPEDEAAPEPVAPPTAGPRIMRRVFPKLDHVAPMSEPVEEPRDEEESEVAEAIAPRHAGTGAEAVIAAESEFETSDIDTSDTGTRSVAQEEGIRFFVPEDEDEDDEESADTEPPVFVGRIAAYEEDEEEDEEEEVEEPESTPDLFEPESDDEEEAPDDGEAPYDEDDEDDVEQETLLEAEEDELEGDEPEEDEREEGEREEDGDEKPSYQQALEEEIEIAAQAADEAEAAGPPVSRNVFEVIAADEAEAEIEESEESEEAGEDEDAELVDDASEDQAEAEIIEVETTPVSEAELALYESSEPEAAEEDDEDLLDTDAVEKAAEAEVLIQEDIELAADEETAEALAEEALFEEEEEVFQLDLEDDAAEAPPAMVFPEALADLPTKRLAGSAEEPEEEPELDVAAENTEIADAEIASTGVQASAPDDDPFADAPVTGTLFEDALPSATRRRRVRPSAARVDRAMDDMMPSLGRMSQKIAELETDKQGKTDPAPPRAFEAGEDSGPA